jgi:hypothetical protein
MRRLSLSGVLVAAVALAGAGCRSEAPTTPTTPAPVSVTETFTGLLTLNSAVTFPFVVSQAGSANLQLKAMDPAFLIGVAAGGTGAFRPGETVFQGTAANAATWSSTVHTWLPGSNQIAILGVTGVFAADGVVTGATSGAKWTGKTIEPTIVGIALGTWSGTTCTIVLPNDLSSVGSQVNGVVQGSGSLCARVYDVGKLPTSANFTIEVTHF